MLFPGAGGYWWRLVHRDTVSAAFKRSATGDHPNVKFSNSPGKESLGGYLRVFARGDVLVIGDASEGDLGEPLGAKSQRRAPQARNRVDIVAAGIVEHATALAAHDDVRALRLVLAQIGLHVHQRCDVARLDRVRDIAHAQSSDSAVFRSACGSAMP